MNIIKEYKEYKESTSNIIILDNLGDSIKIPIRYSLRAKRIAISVNYKGAELILPHKKNPIKGYNFLLTKESWIRKKLQNLIPKDPIDENILPIFGKEYSLYYINANYCTIQITNNLIEVYSNNSAPKAILIKFLQKKLLSEITKSVSFFSKKYNFNVSAIKIINNKNKWGSCSGKAVLSFNWRLIFAPPEVLKYLVVHEMCHIKEMNHSKNFWSLVEHLDPEYKIAKLWLKNNGSNLHQYLLY